MNGRGKFARRSFGSASLAQDDVLPAAAPCRRVKAEEDCRERSGRDRQYNCLSKGVPKCNLGTRGRADPGRGRSVLSPLQGEFPFWEIPVVSRTSCAQPPANVLASLRLTEMARTKSATELRGQLRSQMEFGNEGNSAIQLSAWTAISFLFRSIILSVAGSIVNVIA
jgi:hypothetical protein